MKEELFENTSPINGSSPNCQEEGACVCAEVHRELAARCIENWHALWHGGRQRRRVWTESIEIDECSFFGPCVPTFGRNAGWIDLDVGEKSPARVRCPGRWWPSWPVASSLMGGFPLSRG